MTTRIAIVPKGLKYQKKIQTRVSSGRWVPKFGGMASASREKAFRHVWSKRGDRRIGFFQFRITRDDGTIIDHTLLSGRYDGISLMEENPDAPGYVLIGEAHAYEPEDYPDEIPFWNKIGDTWYYRRDKYEGFPVEFSYNTVTHIWTIPYYTWGSEDWYPIRRGKKFIAYFFCKDSKQCIYVKSPKDNPEYNYKHPYISAGVSIRPGFYEVRAPYYKTTLLDTRVPSPDFPDGGFGTPCGIYASQSYGCCNAAKEQALIMTVESSIDYTVKYNTSGTPSAFYHGTHIYYDSGRTMEECLAAAYEHWYQSDWYAEGGSVYTPGADYTSPEIERLDKVYIPAWVTVTTSKGDISNNIVTNPIDSEESITPVPYTVETNTYRIDAFYTGNDPYDLPRLCNDGTVEFPLTFEVFRLIYGVGATPNLN